MEVKVEATFNLNLEEIGMTLEELGYVNSVDNVATVVRRAKELISDALEVHLIEFVFDQPEVTDELKEEE